MAEDRETRFELARWVTTRAPMSKYNLGTSQIQGRKAGRYLPDEDHGVGSGIFDGDVELRELLAGRYNKGIENVALTAGASEANFLVYYALLRKGGSVVVESPAYTPLTALGEFLEVEVKEWKRRFEDGYALDLEALKVIMEEDDVRLIVLTNLYNPAGVSIPPDSLKATAEIAYDHGAFILCDEIYREFVPDTTIPTVSCGDNCITSASLSKVHGFGGLRLGWTVASEDMTNRILGVREMASVCCSRMDEEMAKRIIRDESVLEEARAIAAENMAIVKDWIARTERVSWVEPDGGILCFPRFEGIGSSLEFAQYLFEKHRTLVSPGFYFGAEDHMRIGCGGDRGTIEGGLEMIGEALKKF